MSHGFCTNQIQMMIMEVHKSSTHSPTCTMKMKDRMDNQYLRDNLYHTDNQYSQNDQNLLPDKPSQLKNLYQG